MRKLFTTSTSLLLLCLSFLTASAQELDQGHLSDRGYVNDYLGFEIPMPEGWWIGANKQLSSLTDTGFYKKDQFNKALDYSVAVDSIDNAYLVMIQKFNPRLRIKRSNPTLIVSIENISKYDPPLKDEGAYLYKAKLQLERGQIEYSFNGGIAEMTIDGKKLRYMQATAQQGEKRVEMRFITLFIKEFAVSFVCNYTTHEEVVELMHMVRKIEFKD